MEYSPLTWDQPAGHTLQPGVPVQEPTGRDLAQLEVWRGGLPAYRMSLGAALGPSRGSETLGPTHCQSSQQLLGRKSGYMTGTCRHGLNP